MHARAGAHPGPVLPARPPPPAVPPALEPLRQPAPTGGPQDPFDLRQALINLGHSPEDAARLIEDQVTKGAEQALRNAGSTASESVLGPYECPRGGTYVLRDPETNEVMRTGRTNDLERRRQEHGRDPELRPFNFEVDRRTDDYAQQRGREQVVHNQYDPPLNRIQPISPRNPRRQEYLDAAAGMGE